MADYRSTLALAAGIGAIAGMRSMSAPALLSHHLAGRRRRRRSGKLGRLMASSTASGAFKLLAIGEASADKTPFVPARTEAQALVGRAAFGGMAGATVASWRGQSLAGAAVVGSVSAIASTFAAYYLRKNAGKALKLPDPLLGVAEDMLVLVAGSRIVSAL